MSAWAAEDQRPRASSRTTIVAAERLGEVLVEVADTLTDGFDLRDFLRMVTAHASELVAADAAGVLLVDDHARLQLMTATDGRARALGTFEIEANEGPSQDAFRRADAVTDPDLAATDRWPNFAPRAVVAGFRSVHAFPLRLRQQVIGVLDLYGTGAGRMRSADVRVLQALADTATIGVLQHRAIRRGEALTDQLQRALTSRVIIEQAKGRLAQVHAVTPEQAFELMRAYSRTHRWRLGEIAELVIQDPAALPELMSPDRP
jgi:GAF domain-containing protein